MPLAVFLPLIAAAGWGRYVAPATSRRLHDPVRAIFELVIFTAAVIALASTGHSSLAITLALVTALTATGSRRYEPPRQAVV